MQLLQNINDWFQNLSLRHKLLIIVLNMSALVIFVGLVGFYISYEENKRILFQYENRLLSVKWLNSIWANLRENEANFYKLILIPDPTIRKQLINEIETRKQLWILDANYYRTIALHDAYEDKELPLLQEETEIYNSRRDKAIQLAIAGKKQEFLDYYLPNLPLLEKIRTRIKNLSEYNDKMAEKEYKDSLKKAKISYLIVFGSILLALALILSLTLIVSENIIKSIKILAEKMKQVASGNLDVAPIEVKYKDEIGSLIESFNIMTDDLRRIILKEKITKEREEFLRNKVDEQRKNFLTTLTHDLRSPLLAEQKALEAILSKSMGESLEDFSEYLEDMHTTNDALLRIVNNMLLIDYYESENIDLEMEPRNIKDIIDAAIKSMKPLAENNETEIITEIPTNLSQVKANYDEITRVIINLIGNAIKHNTKGTTIKISAEKINNEIQVAVSDNGKGIPEKEKGNIFKKYPSNKRKTGSGLGLYLSKQIINAHNGKIWFKTEENKGSTFYLTLPLNDEKPDNIP